MTTIYQTPHSYAYRIGMMDAIDGKMGCTPEMYFVVREDMREYCRGYESVAGPTLTTQQFLSDSQRVAYVEAIAPMPAGEKFGLMLGAMVGTEDLANMPDTLEYESAIEDQEWIRRGC